MNQPRIQSKLVTLLGTTSLLTTLAALSVHAQEAMPQVAQTSEEIPENVLITGSLIRGTVAVGVPVTNLSPQDFAVTGSVTISDLFKDFPAANVVQSSSATVGGGHTQRENRVNLRGLDATGPRTLMMVDGMRYPPQADGICAIDPSVIPAIALDHIDILADGASATYGSDAIAGVINIILKRNYDGAQTQLGFNTASSGHFHYQVSQLWGRTWDGGQITLSFEWYDDSKVKGTAHSNFTVDFRPWGFDDRRPLASSAPGTITTGAPGLPFDGYVAPSSCTNCYAIPKGAGRDFNSSINGGLGPLTPGSASTLNWATFSTDPNFNNGVVNGVPTTANGVRNVVDPNTLGWEEAPQQRNAFVMTVDQRLTKDISFFGEGFYSNRRGSLLDPPYQTPTNNVALSSIAIPTFNPYYPAGAPGGLRVAYDLTIERPALTNFYETSQRYAFGLNIALPANWQGKLFYSQSADANVTAGNGAINRNAVSAALGWTLSPVAALGTEPGFASWTRPTSVPYLNLFCDPYIFKCNSDTTLNYIGAFRTNNEKMWENEKGLTFDGPLFDLPGGTVKIALGADYLGVDLSFIRTDQSGSPNLTVAPQIGANPYHVWATFAQLNIPIFGDNNAIPFFRRLDLEASWRHDQYGGDLNGGTSNPKVGFTWLLDQDVGFSVKGSWGTSFRFANAGEYSPVFSTAIAGFNTPQAFQQGGAPGTLAISCTGGAPPAGSGAAKVFSSGKFACNDKPFGLNLGGANTLLLRPFLPGTQTPALAESFLLKPEQATNWSIGFDLSPTKWLPGLDLQATYYIIKLTNVLTPFNIQSTSTFNRPADGFHYIVPSDLAALDPACNVAANANPAACPEFQAMVAGILNNVGNSQTSPNAQTSVFFINDGGTVNQGSRKVDGIDFSASYDWDMGNLGAFNTGIVGTYYLHDTSITVPGSDPTDRYHQTLATIGSVTQAGVPVLPYFRYRARLGWSDGPWNVTGFMNYVSHYYQTLASPPNVNANVCISPGATLVGGNSPCAIQNYNNLEPSWYSFDLSIGYDTGEDPANDYLKNIGINLVVRDIFDKAPAFQYVQPNPNRTGVAYELIKDNEGRIFSVVLTKTW